MQASTHFRHRFGHQSGLDEISGQKSTIFKKGFAFLVHSVFSKALDNHQMRATVNVCLLRNITFWSQPVQPSTGLGVPIHKMSLISITIDYCIPLVLLRGAIMLPLLSIDRVSRRSSPDTTGHPAVAQKAESPLKGSTARGIDSSGNRSAPRPRPSSFWTLVLGPGPISIMAEHMCIKGNQ